MKVIVVGFSKTGGNSMKAALTELGYNVYDYLENFQYLGKEWTKILSEGGTTEDFRRMFENVDAVNNIPACYFWDEIHKAFPESKIILTIRESEEEWCESMTKHIQETNNIPMWFLTRLSPTMWQLMSFLDLHNDVIFGSKINWSLFNPPRHNMMLMLMRYRRHNSHVLQTAPKKKLLVFNSKDGWEALCEFLNVEVPDKPFPQEYIGGKLNKEYRTTDPLFIRSKYEMYFSLSCLTLLLGYGVYKLMK